MAARSALKAFWRDESGATAIEYGLIAAMIFLAIVTGVTLFAGKTVAIFDLIGQKIGAAI